MFEYILTNPLFSLTRSIYIIILAVSLIFLKNLSGRK